MFQRNPLGKQLIDYVIESGDETNMIRFLETNFDRNNEQKLLMLINEQLKHKKKQTIFQKMYAIMSRS
jgi:hypothetical protein